VFRREVSQVAAARIVPKQLILKVNHHGSSSYCRVAGPLRGGKGRISTDSGALSNVPYGFATRFEQERGTIETCISNRNS
jgi:hypothetical protein